jgi:hypothetical protein
MLWAVSHKVNQYLRLEASRLITDYERIFTQHVMTSGQRRGLVDFHTILRYQGNNGVITARNYYIW